MLKLHPMSGAIRDLIQAGNYPGWKGVKLPVQMRPVPTAEVRDAELQMLHGIAGRRTPEGNELAQWLDDYSRVDLWEHFLDDYARKVSPEKAADARQLLRATLSVTHNTSDAMKHQVGRPRPFVEDPTLSTVLERPWTNPSYPSGHSAQATAGAEVLAQLMPERAEEFRKWGRLAIFSRAYGGVHYPSDVISGASLGEQVARQMIERWNTRVPWSTGAMRAA